MEDQKEQKEIDYVKDIQVKLFDEKRDTVTGDLIYWVKDRTLFPFQRTKLEESEFELMGKIEQEISLSDSEKKCEILARLLKKQLENELTLGEEKEFEGL